MRSWRHLVTGLLALLLIAPSARTAPPVTPPAQAFDQDPGSDYFVADYTSYEKYLKLVAGQSDRIKLIDMGRTSEGRSQWMAVVSSPENLARLEEFQDISRRLARAQGLGAAEARGLASMGKAILWIEAGQHANESVPMQGQIQVLYRMLAADDEETLRILKDTILLFVASNPDGMEIYGDWYMRYKDPSQRRRDPTPVPWQKFVGHDNNRDYYMSHMPETTNINRGLYKIWSPQILLSQHQMILPGAVVFISPEQDPTNYRIDPVVLSKVDELGAVVRSALMLESLPGVVTGTTAPFTKWASGTMHGVARFHNILGFLTEINGNASPDSILMAPDLQLPKDDAPMPVAPQPWQQSQSIHYQWSINRAIMSYGARNREELLFNSYLMARAAIDKGSRDSWSPSPARVEALKREATPLTEPPTRNQQLFKQLLRNPADRDPRAYIIPPDQPDLPTTIEFLNALMKTGVVVERARNGFNAGGQHYPRGSWVVRTAQAYRAHLMDMFEPQEYPAALEYPGGPPKRPFDVTGYTLAYQMGIEFDRALDPFHGTFEEVNSPLAPPPGRIVGSGKAGWLFAHDKNVGFTLTNRLLKAGVAIAWATRGVRVAGVELKPGAVWVPRSRTAYDILRGSTRELGITAHSMARQPAGDLIKLKPVRIGLVNRYGGLRSAGWTQWLFEKYEFPNQLVYPQRLDAGNLRQEFDVLLFGDGALGEPEEPPLAAVPEQFRSWTGTITRKRTAPALENFIREGGAVVAIGSSTALAAFFVPAVESATTRLVANEIKPFDAKEFYVPGSLLRADVDQRHPLAFGLPAHVDVFFQRGQAFKIKHQSARPVASFGRGKLLRSGLAIGEEKLQGTAAVLDVSLGKGKMFLMGPDVVNRAQSYGTFKFLFNSLLYGPAAAQH